MADQQYGVNFAPTADNALNGPRNGAQTGVPDAIQILSFNLPRILGVKPIAPGQLLNARGANGQDPYAAVVASILSSMAQHQLGGLGATAMPGGTFHLPTQPPQTKVTPGQRQPTMPGLTMAPPPPAGLPSPGAPPSYPPRPRNPMQA